MLIAVASDSADMQGAVPTLFAEAPYLLIVNAETGELLHSLPRTAGGDMAFAAQMLSLDCEGLLCGPIAREPFLRIADDGCITRYNAAGLRVGEALARFSRRDLELIRDHIDGEGCQSRSGDACTGHEHG